MYDIQLRMKRVRNEPEVQKKKKNIVSKTCVVVNSEQVDYPPGLNTSSFYLRISVDPNESILIIFQKRPNRCVKSLVK